jgi:hypothetical protein
VDLATSPWSRRWTEMRGGGLALLIGAILPFGTRLR